MAPSMHEVPPEYSGAAYGLASELRVVLGRLLRRLRSAHALGLTQTAVLGRLDRDGAQPTGVLARNEGVRPQSMSQTVAELEAAGLVRRSADASDGRRSLVSLTDAGREALHEDRAQREGFLARLIDERLSAEERELLERAVELLRRISDPG
jgi:DNA-binding MarR family transcriptional regulator